MSELDLKLSYFTGDEMEQFSFLRLPKMLFSDPRFKKISTDCKVLYSFMLDRVSLSITNGWKDKEGRIYIIFTAEEASLLLGKTTRSITNLMKDLNKDTGIGLIERKKQGLGKPDLIFVKNFASLDVILADPPLSSDQEEKKLPLQTGKSCLSRSENFSAQEEKKVPAIKTNPTNTKNTKTEVLKPTLPPNPKITVSEEQPRKEEKDGWLDLKTEEQYAFAARQLKQAYRTGQGEVTRLLYQLRTNESKLETTLYTLMGMKEMDCQATTHQEYTTRNLHYRATKLYARALLEMLTSEKLTKTKDGFVSYGKIIEKLTPHLVYSDIDQEVRLDSIASCTVMAYLEASKDSEVKFPLPYMKSCIWTTLREGNIREEADFHYRYG